MPVVYPLIALSVAAALLPSALRPPPEQTSDSAALNPDAPPDEQQEEIVQAIQQAQGGAGGDETESTTTTAAPNRPLASNRCFGNPPRQTESVYSAPCAAAFTGNNGGATGHNVFPNEVRLGFWHAAGTPAAGKIGPEPAPNESAPTRTFRVLNAYVNQRFQTYGRRIQFYGLTGSSDPAAEQAAARKADAQDKIFAAYHLNLPFCEEFVRSAGPVFCNPNRASIYERNRPGFYSFMLDRTAAAGFGAEYVCKKLIGKNAVYSGTERNNLRKISVVTETSIDSAKMPVSEYDAALKKECGAAYGGRSYQFAAADATVALAAATQMQASGTTTVVLEIGVVNTLLLMTAASTIGWEPEWVTISAEATDFGSNAAILPPNQSRHLFGLTAWEVPRRYEESECFQAYKSIDQDNEPDSAVCRLFWHSIILMVDAIQQAGPRLDKASFERGLFSLGHRYPVEPWAIGGGYGPGDYSYMDDVSEIWFSRFATNPDNGQPGAYAFTYNAKRFKRGELPAGDDQLFQHGVTSVGGPDIRG